MQNCFAERARLIWNKVPHKKYKTSSTVMWETHRRVQKKGKHTSIFHKRSNAQGTSRTTGDCFSYINLSDLILSSFWTSDPQQDESATLDSQPGCGGITWALSSCSGRCYISFLPGTCHLQASHPLGLQINSHFLCPSVARSDSSLWCSGQERLLWFIDLLYRILSETWHPPEGKSCFQRWWASELAKKLHNLYFWFFYSFLNILSIWFTCLTRKELS